MFPYAIHKSTYIKIGEEQLRLQDWNGQGRTKRYIRGEDCRAEDLCLVLSWILSSPLLSTSPILFSSALSSYVLFS